jgi:hypothetical protein
MSRGKWRPWRFSLRFLLLLTAVIAAGAAFFGWRERQLGPQRRAVARIVDLGGSIEVERHGWFEAIRRGCDTEEVVSVTLPGHVADDAIGALEAFSSLKHVTMAYSRREQFIIGGYSPHSFYYDFVIDGQHVAPRNERSRYDRLQSRFSHLDVRVSHNGAVVPTDTAFDGYR